MFGEIIHRLHVFMANCTQIKGKKCIGGQKITKQLLLLPLRTKLAACPTDPVADRPSLASLKALRSCFCGPTKDMTSLNNEWNWHS